MLVESINRLWTLKHKELGRFSGTLFRLVEAVIDQVLFGQCRITCISKRSCLSLSANKCRFIRKMHHFW